MAEHRNGCRRLRCPLLPVALCIAAVATTAEVVEEVAMPSVRSVAVALPRRRLLPTASAVTMTATTRMSSAAEAAAAHVAPLLQSHVQRVEDFRGGA